ncbi:MAG: efflux transporter periplasmic adaptor subunit [Mucilaginibacter sp.]|nr:efflux transporter periplasmic adaptor subunit [Mucilaginibacter sp.]
MKSIQNSYIILILIGLGITTAVSTGCGRSDAKNKKILPAATSPGLEGFPVKKGSLSSALTVPGELNAFQQVDIYAKVNSFVQKLYVDVGTEVITGQLLARMDAPELNSQLDGAESKLKSQEAVYLASKTNYDRLLETSKTPGTISSNDLDIAFAHQKSDQETLDAAKAAYREIADTKNYLEIRAPFSGVISARNVSAGAYVGPSGKGSDAPLFTLQEQKKLRLIVSVPEAYSTSVKQNETVNFTVKSLPGQLFTARVTRQAGVLDTRLRAQHIEMDVINDEKRVLPGMVTEVNIPLSGDADSFVVPSGAVLNSTTGVFVIRVADGKMSWVPVETGRMAGNQTEVFGKLIAGDTLLNNVSEEMREGTLVPAVRIK